LEASSRGPPCRLTLLYRDPGPPGWQSLLRAGLVAAHSLIVSYNVRRWACVEAYARLDSGGWLRLRVEGARVRGLAVQETSLEGLLRSLLRGDRWPGIALSEAPEPPREPAGCMPAEALVAGGVRDCPECVVVKGIEGRLQPWWTAAAAMVVLDEPCGGCP